MAVSKAKIFPHLWYTKEAEEAAAFYTSLFPDSRIDRVTPLQTETPSGPPGSVKVVDFTLFGQRFQAISAGPLDAFNHAISLVVTCDDQAELDRYWNGMLAAGGKEEACGWMRDHYGVAWQIVPAMLGQWMDQSKDKAAAKRVEDVMMKMVKLDIARLQAAWEGKA